MLSVSVFRNSYSLINLSPLHSVILSIILLFLSFDQSSSIHKSLCRELHSMPRVTYLATLGFAAVVFSELIHLFDDMFMKLLATF